jgi:transcription factor IIIB subunit 2
MQALANQLSIQESVVSVGVQIFKLASMNNFIQGRRTDMVAAVCLYSACRKEKPCRVMLIDFADKIQVSLSALPPSRHSNFFRSMCSSLEIPSRSFTKKSL